MRVQGIIELGGINRFTLFAASVPRVHESGDFAHATFHAASVYDDDCAHSWRSACLRRHERTNLLRVLPCELSCKFVWQPMPVDCSPIVLFSIGECGHRHDADGYSRFANGRRVDKETCPARRLYLDIAKALLRAIETDVMNDVLSNDPALSNEPAQFLKLDSATLGRMSVGELLRVIHSLESHDFCRDEFEHDHRRFLQQPELERIIHLLQWLRGRHTVPTSG